MTAFGASPDMYAQYFGFGKLPFRLRPDAEFLYSSEEYLEARTETLAALRGHARSVLLLGQPGVGKTLLLADVLRTIAGEFNACRVNQPHISATELLQALLLQMGTRGGGGDAHHSTLLLELTAGLNAAGSRGGTRPLLIIDDAQLLAGATLHTLGEILADAPRLQILLVGEDDQGQRGADLAARIAVAQKPRRVRLAPLDADGTKAYVEHRLRIAGGGVREVFTADAYQMLFRKTGGTPRLINILCDAALNASYLRASNQVGADDILAATRNSPLAEAAAPDDARPSAPPSQPHERSSQEPPSAAAACPDAAASRAAAGPPAARLLVSRGEEHVLTWPLAPGRISIGRASDNELRLDASFISRHHCQVVTDGMVATIEDLGSVNGMSVNGKSVKRHVLENSDQVIIGDHVITYVVG